MINFLVELDKKVFLFFNSMHSPFFDKIMWHISGKVEWIPLYMVILYFLIKTYKLKSIYFLVIIVLLITLSDQLSVIVFKNTIKRLRPCHDPSIMNLVHIVNNYCGGMYGFVSNHASNSFALAMYSSFLYKKKIYKILIFIWAILVAYSRVYLGVHYPGDVIGGAIFGMLLAYLLWLFTDRIIISKVLINKNERNKKKD